MILRLMTFLGFAACSLGALAGAYDFDAQDGKYTYIYPYYVVEVANGVSNNLANCQIIRVASAEAEAEVIGVSAFRAAATGTFFKTGPGWLTIDEGLASWTGDFHVMAGVLHVNHNDGFGLSSGANAAYAHDGATLFTANPPGITKLDANNYSCSRTLAFEGTGYNDMGALRVANAGAESTWPLMRYPTLTDDALLVLDNASSVFQNWRPDGIVRLNGYTLTLRGAPERTRPVFRLNESAMELGSVVCENMALNLTLRVALQGGSSGLLHFKEKVDGAFSQMSSANGRMRTWTWRIDSMRSLQLSNNKTDGLAWDVGETNQMDWAGPVELNADMPIYNNSDVAYHHIGVTFKGPISGPGGIRPYRSSNPARYNGDMAVHLLSPENSFEGGVTLTHGSRLFLYADGALPQTAAAASLTNSALYLVGKDVFHLPEVVIAGTGLVHQASYGGGSAQSITKLGQGDLLYFSNLGADVLNLKGGSLTLPKYAPDWSSVAGLTEWTNRYVLVQKYGWDQGIYYQSSITSLQVRAAAKCNNGTWNTSLGLTNGNFEIAYRGYVWNRTPTNETWTFASVMDKGGKLLIDGEVLFAQPARNQAVTANYLMTPGPHEFEFRYYQTSGNSGATDVHYTSGNVFKYIDDVLFDYGKGANPCYAVSEDGEGTVVTNGCWKSGFGFMVDRQGRRSYFVDDYERPIDAGDGFLFTTSTNTAALPVFEPAPVFGTLVAAAGTSLDLNGWDYAQANLTGLPAVSNGTFTVTGTWTIPGGDIAAGAELDTDGAFTVADDAQIVFSDVASCPRANAVVARAAGGITIPAGYNGKRMDAKGRFRLRQTSPTELTLTYSAGTLFVFR